MWYDCSRSFIPGFFNAFRVSSLSYEITTLFSVMGFFSSSNNNIEIFEAGWSCDPAIIDLRTEYLLPVPSRISYSVMSRTKPS